MVRPRLFHRRLDNSQIQILKSISESTITGPNKLPKMPNFTPLTPLLVVIRTDPTYKTTLH